MSFKVEISHNTDKNSWDKMLLKSNFTYTYQTMSWQKMFEKVYNSKPIFISVTNSSNEVVGQLAGIIHHEWFWRNSNIFSKNIGNFFNLGKVLHWFYGPIIHDKSNENLIMEKILSSIDKLAFTNNVEMIRGLSSPLSNSFGLKKFSEFNYKMHKGTTFIIDLEQGEDQIYNSLKKDMRYDVRRAEKKDFEFEIVTNKESLTEFQEINLQVSKLQGKKIIRDPSFFDEHWKLLHKEGFEQLLVTRQNGKNVGGILTLVFNGNVIQHALTNLPNSDELVGTFLTWNTIKWAIKNGYKTFDFAGVNPNPVTKKEKGIYYYAKKWGGKLHDYTVYTKMTNKNKFRISNILRNPDKILKIKK
jgi:hypothetical protein